MSRKRNSLQEAMSIFDLPAKVLKIMGFGFLNDFPYDKQ
jgi:hypothetical protein